MLKSSWIICSFVTWNYMVMAQRCPIQCTCDRIADSRQRVNCDQGGLTTMPTLDLEPDINILNISAPDNNLNKLNVGPIFARFFNMEEIHITYSRVPAIGEYSFYTKAIEKLRVLNLSHNNIRFLLENNFIGLGNLEQLYLNSNQISSISSHVFIQMPKLKILSLAKNNISDFPPRFFLGLESLETLILDGNFLTNLNLDIFQDTRMLKLLSLNSCGLQVLPLRLFQIANLEILYVQNNNLKAIPHNYFQKVRNLSALYLDNNNISYIPRHIFQGLTLEHLGLSGNQNLNLTAEVFSESFISGLDLSNNRVTHIHSDIFKNIVSILIFLDLSGNNLYLDHLFQNMHNLQRLILENVGLKTLSNTIFDNLSELKILSLARNQLSVISSRLFYNVKKLETLDISENRFSTLSQEVINKFHEMKTLQKIYLKGNPWSCDCHLLPMIYWLKTFLFYIDICENNFTNCPSCSRPDKLSGKLLYHLVEDDLTVCDPLFDYISLSIGSQIGVVLTGMLIILILFIIFVVWLRQRKVHYRTHEESRSDDAIYENPISDDEDYKTNATQPLTKEYITDNKDYSFKYKNQSMEMNDNIKKI